MDLLVNIELSESSLPTNPLATNSRCANPSGHFTLTLFSSAMRPVLRLVARSSSLPCGAIARELSCSRGMITPSE